MSVYLPTSVLVFCLLFGCTAKKERGPSLGAAASQADGATPEDMVRFPSDGRMLNGWLFKPDGAGPFPAVVYNHGSERNPSMSVMGATADFFKSHGYVTFFPFRRGSGGSEGRHWQEAVGAGSALTGRALLDALDAENADVVAAVAWLQAQPFVDPRRVALAGCSFGGIHVVLAAEKPLGIVAALDFAGASMSWQRFPALQERLKRAVRKAHAPIFFIQASNDFDTTPSQVLSAEMEREGKRSRMKIYPPHGNTPMAGHAHFCNHGQAEWGEDVLAFLRDPER